MIKVAAAGLALALLGGCAGAPHELSDNDYIWKEYRTDETAVEVWRHLRGEFKGCGLELGHLQCIESPDFKSFECDSFAVASNMQIAFNRFYINEGQGETAIRSGSNTRLLRHSETMASRLDAIFRGETGVCKKGA